MSVSTDLPDRQLTFEVPHLDRFQRIETLHVVDDFMPATKPEQVEAMSVKAFDDHMAGAAAHLAEVATRQHKPHVNTEDPTAAPRALTRSYVDWALDAQKSGKELGALLATLEEIDNPHHKLEVLDELKDPEMTRGLLKFMRHFELSMLRETGSVESVGFDPQLIEFELENGGIMVFLDWAKEVWTAGSVKRRLPEAINSQGARAGFWLPTLVKVVKHSPKELKLIAQEGLDRFYGRDGEE